MNKRLISALVACSPLAPAMAQSSVTIYGTVGLGITRADNIAGSANTLMESGVLRASRLGFTGSEDLGGGLSAVFTLEQGFFANNGSLGQGGRAWGRQAWVGLSSTQWGALTLGRQYDMMNRLVRYTTAGDVGAVYAFHHGDYDRVSGFRIDNAIKYVSPVWGGFQAAALASTSDSTPGRTFSGGVSYVNGPLDVAFSFANTRDQTINPSLDLGVPTFLGGAATSFTAPRVKPIGAGISYEFGSFKPHLALTRVTIERGARSADLDSVDVGGTYTLGAASIGAGVTHAKLEGARWTQYSLGYIFNLSRRTKVYTNVNYQTASGTARNAVMPTLAASSDKSQLVPHIGLTHNF